MKNNKVTSKKTDVKTTSATKKGISGITKSTKNIQSGNYFLYKSHVENVGWTVYSSLGLTTGTTGQSKRLEALRFTSNTFIDKFRAQAHVQNKGWLPWIGYGDILGTVGEGRRLEAIRIDIPASYATNVRYRVHVENIGWMDYKTNNQIAGTTGRSLGIEAFEIHMDIV